ncbi:MAG TPA: single-stranded-DNA-specific exonuclease RecJ [Candidatus Paceibacterota bacterium]|jgi:single-stranded-DNA-specific exonuclease|nr:single-stranded-DNA-specific exonuclease RecJ [Candidatus Paceibacterota bacterium]
MLSFHDPLDAATRDALRPYDDLTAALLARRGIVTAEDAEAFLQPDYDAHIGDPLLIFNMEKAARRIAAAIDAQERITVWSDYDCDGIPGGALLHDFFKKAKANFTNYIPHRHLEGFGLNEIGLKKLAEEGTTLVITVDCGIADVEQVAFANALGMEVIVTDHHLPRRSADGAEELPPAFAVIDPKQEGETNAFRDFCGGGLAWKLACAVLATGFKGREEIPAGWEKWLLDMAGLSTIADMVPLIGENRVIARYGLLVMRKSPRIGFQRLCSAARVNQRFITEDDVGFMIAPRVNAASRMGNPRDAFELFTTDDEARADELAKELERVNRSRKASGAAVTRAAHERLEKRKEELGGALPAVIAMGDPDWRPGLLGLVANSLAEEYERPVFLWGREGSTTAKGSCRAGGNSVSLVALMELASDVFVEAGGHAASGGFTLKDDAVFTFEEKLCEAYAKLPPTSLADTARIADYAIEHADELAALLKRTEQLAPYGMANPKPLFALQQCEVTQVSWFGKGEEHLRVRVIRDDGFARAEIEAITFFARRELGKSWQMLETGKPATLLGTLERDTFTRGQPVRMRLVAIG